MTKKQLEKRVGELLTLWEERLLPHWNVTYSISPQCKLEGGPNAWAFSRILSGERALCVTIAGDLPWGESIFDLEHTVVHEVVHAVLFECGMRVGNDAVRPYVPAPVWAMFDETQEVLVDRIANELIRAYGRATE